VSEGVRVHENPRPQPLAANVNAGIAVTSGEYVLTVNPDAIPEPGAVRTLVAFADAHPRCGIAGPQMRWPDGTWQPSRRRFPTVRGTIVRRTPLRRLRPPYETQRDHYQRDEERTEPVEADWLLGAFLLMRRSMLDELGGWDAGFRHYCEDIDVCYRAMQAGWERWYVPAALVTHDYAAVIDRRFLSRHTLWHLRGMARFVRKHPERLLAL
jgi:GT2 family glycosyltransferase